MTIEYNRMPIELIKFQKFSNLNQHLIAIINYAHEPNADATKLKITDEFINLLL